MPIGLLAALLSVQRGLQTHVLDRATAGPKPDLAHSLGATYHSELPADLAPDVVIETTGAAQLVFEVLATTGPNAVTVLTGLSAKRRTVALAAGSINDELVLDNDVVVGSVNANLRHYRAAAAFRTVFARFVRQLRCSTSTFVSMPGAPAIRASNVTSGTSSCSARAR